MTFIHNKCFFAPICEQVKINVKDTVIQRGFKENSIMERLIVLTARGFLYKIFVNKRKGDTYGLARNLEQYRQFLQK